MERGLRAYLEDQAELFKALGHPVRLCLLMKLAQDGSSSVADIGSCMDVSQSNLSQHLAKLRALDIVEGIKDENRVFYDIKREDVRRLLMELMEDYEA